MLDTIEKIIEADETAWEELQTARMKAQSITAEARRTAEEAFVQRTADRAALLKSEVEGIMAEARSRVDQIKQEADAYLEDRRRKKESVLNDLVDELFKKVTAL